MITHDIIVIGASAGGVETLSKLVRALPENLPAAIFLVLHIPNNSTSALPNILKRYCKLKVAHAQDCEAIEHGKIYIAPPNYHLLLKPGYVSLSHGPRENSHRPAVDPLFRTAARAYGRRVVGVVLSGVLDDGTAGLIAVKMRGGVAIVQDPEEAMFSGMPRSAIENVDQVDYILPVAEIASVLVRLAGEPVAEEASEMPQEMEIETDITELDQAVMHKDERPGTPSGFACPSCGGALWEIRDGQIFRFRCRTGHAFSGQSLLAEQSEAMEEALWSAFRALEESAALSRRMAKRASDRNQQRSADRFAEQAQESEQRAELLRQLLIKQEDRNPQLSRVNGMAAPSNGEVRSSAHTPPATGSSNFKVVGIGASIGGLKALSEVLAALPADFGAAIAIVQHIEPNRASLLPEILNSRTPLSVKEAKDGEALQPGCIFIAAPNKHLLINPDGTLHLSNAEMVHFVRPSADLLFESLAASFKENAIAVVLTGKGVDGALGVQAIKKMGGVAIATDEATSHSFGMPSAAIDTGAIDKILPLNEIASALVNLVTTKKVSP